jgi:hypothetical protein
MVLYLYCVLFFRPVGRKTIHKELIMTRKRESYHYDLHKSPRYALFACGSKVLPLLAVLLFRSQSEKEAQ